MRMRRWQTPDWLQQQLVLLALQQLIPNTNAIPIDNGLVGTPTIECGPEEFIVHFKTQKPFGGNVYAKGFFESDNCKVGATQSTDVSIKLKYNTLANCGVRRRRMTSPRGMAVEDTVVIMFHPMFLTKVDRAFRIECMYMEGAKVLTHGLDVSMLTTQELSAGGEMPTCKYEVLAGGPDGEPVKYAYIGDMVYHKWTCDASSGDTHCMTVHSCSVDDGQGETRLLLDENGCAQDRYLLQNLEYQSPSQAGREAHVFKFADKPTLYFSCQIKMMPLIGDNCVRTADSCAEAVEAGAVVSASQDTVPADQPLELEREKLGQLVETIAPFPVPKPLEVEPGRVRRLQRTPSGNASRDHETALNLDVQDTEQGAAFVLLPDNSYNRPAAVPGEPGQGAALRHLNPPPSAAADRAERRLKRSPPASASLTPPSIQTGPLPPGRPSVIDLLSDEPVAVDVDVVTDGITVLDIIDSAGKPDQPDGSSTSLSERELIGRERLSPDVLSVVQISSSNFGLLMFSLVFLMMTTAASTVFAMYSRCQMQPAIKPRSERYQ